MHPGPGMDVDLQARVHRCEFMCCVHMLNNVSREIEVTSVKGPYAPLPFVFSPKVPHFPLQYGLTMIGPLNSPFIRNTSHIHTCRYIHVRDHIIGYMHIGVSTCDKCTCT